MSGLPRDFDKAEISKYRYFTLVCGMVQRNGGGVPAEWLHHPSNAAGDQQI
jgi:hypothetical protein